MKNKVYLVLYYVFCLLVLSSRQNMTAAPSLVVRLAFMAVVVIPVLYNKYLSYPAIIIMFYTLAKSGFAYSYMPYSLEFYLGVTLIVWLLTYNKNGNSQAPAFLWFFSFYIIIIDLINAAGDSSVVFWGNHSYCFLLLCLFLLFSKRDNRGVISQMSICIMTTSIILAVLFLLNRDRFVIDYSTEADLERSGWTDPNYFGMVVGMGIVVGLLLLFGKKSNTISRLEKNLSIASFFICLPALVLIASRGAILSVVISCILLVLLSDVNNSYKVLAVVVALAFVYFLYVNQYFNLLVFRIQNDYNGGSGRSEIWTSKLRAYSNGSLLHILFGYGRYGGLGIAGVFESSHNDYISFLVQYGLVGISLFLYMLYYPIKRAIQKSENKNSVIVLMAYLLVCCITLEPFGIGSLAFYGFYMYALLMANNETCTYYSKRSIA